MLHRIFCHTPIGMLEVSGNEVGIRGVRLVKETEPKVTSSAEPPSCLHEAVCQLLEYFQRRRTAFDLPLDLSTGTTFHQSVWRELIKIPYGKTASYSAIAAQLGNPAAVRAVGQANRQNPIAIIIPCHRVIAKNGNLHGYFYGSDIKRRLLALENPSIFTPQNQLF